ncbi:MAG: hypothetical protein DMF68_16180 [Acidobacteria bacterium]|nr:MAG: hypothetical protein DMF68_16180 [Acidobacteriota bacterium]
MAEAIEREGSSMKREGMLLNVVCLVMALLFFGLAGLNFFSAGNFISTDSLFFTSVCGLMALLFLLVPLMTMRAARREKKAAAGELSSASAARTGALAGGTRPLIAPVRYADAVDARGRRIPPDVARMVEVMSEREEAGS